MTLIKNKVMFTVDLAGIVVTFAGLGGIVIGNDYLVSMTATLGGLFILSASTYIRTKSSGKEHPLDPEINWDAILTDLEEEREAYEKERRSSDKFVRLDDLIESENGDK